MSWKSLHFFHPFQSWNSISTLGSILKYTFIELLQLGLTGFFILITKWYIHDNGKDTLQRDFFQKRPRQLRRLCHASILFYSSNFMAVLRLSKSARFRFLLTSLPDSFFSSLPDPLQSPLLAPEVLTQWPSSTPLNLPIALKLSFLSDTKFVLSISWNPTTYCDHLSSYFCKT